MHVVQDTRWFRRPGRWWCPDVQLSAHQVGQVPLVQWRWQVLQIHKFIVFQIHPVVGMVCWEAYLFVMIVFACDMRPWGGDWLPASHELGYSPAPHGRWCKLAWLLSPLPTCFFVWTDADSLHPGQHAMQTLVFPCEPGWADTAKMMGSTCSHTKQPITQPTNQRFTPSWPRPYANQTSLPVCFCAGHAGHESRHHPDASLNGNQSCPYWWLWIVRTS